jgi:hypothetical protein
MLFAQTAEIADKEKTRNVASLFFVSPVSDIT